MSFLNRFINRQAALLKSAAEDTRGLAAIEFAMIAPVMLMTTMGVVELAAAMTIDRRVQQVAESVADLTARDENQLSMTTMPDIMTSSQYILSPYATAPAVITVRQILSSPTNANNQKQAWSCTYVAGSSALTCACSNTAYSLPANIMKANDNVIVGQVTYDYKPVGFSYFMKAGWSSLSDGAGGFNLTETAYMKPRGNANMFVQANGVACPTPTFP